MTKLFDMIYKGGAGSGNFGHSGRPGQIGGSSDSGGSSFPKDAKDITSEQAMKQANYQDIKSQMKKNLSEIKQGESKQIDVSGELDSQTASDIEKNMKSELSLYGNYLAGDTMATARDYIDDFREVVNRGIKDGSLKDIKAEDLNKLGIDNVNKLIHQEVESNRQAFTDHGIRHIVGDVLRQRQIMREMNPEVIAKQELMGDFAMLNHDIGYTAPLIREGGERGIAMTKKHPLFSQKITEEQRDIWNKDKIFSVEEYDKITEVIKTHDSTKIDKNDILSTSSRISDNLSLFSKEKLPSVFKYVPGGDTYLVNMGIAAEKKDTTAFEKHKKDLYKKIDESNISTSLKRDLKAATREIGFLTPKFTLGVLAGEIDSIKKESGKINISIQYNSYDAKMQKLFDMGQKQTKKFLEENGVTDFSKTKYDIGDMLRLEVKGYKEEKRLFDIIYKGGRGSGNFGHSGRPGAIGGSSTSGSSKETIGRKDTNTSNEKQLKETVEQFNSFNPTKINDLKYKGLYDIVSKEGRFFTPDKQPRPKDIPKGEDKDCYRNATLLTIDNPDKYTYVEGIAFSKGINGLPFEHAWCIDNKTKKVIETTWKESGTAYYGVPFNSEYVMKISLKNKVYGLMAGYSSGVKDIYENGFPKNAIKKESKKKKSLLDIVGKHLSGQHDQSTHAGDSGGKGIQVLNEKELRKNPKEVKKIHEEMAKQWDGDRRALGRLALYDMCEEENKSLKGMLIKDGIETVGVVAYEKSSNGKDIYLAMVATKRKGYGRNLVKDIVKIAVKKNMGIRLFSDSDAIPFYDAIGFKKKGESVKGRGQPFAFTYKEAKAWLGTQKKMYEDIEPESGIFVNNRELKKKEVKLFDIIYKGGAGSGSWSGQGQPRFNWSKKDEAIFKEGKGILIDCEGVSDRSVRAINNIQSFTKDNHAYRGMTSDEFNNTIDLGKGIQSRNDYSFSIEGTSFGSDFATASSYVNFGRDNPRVTKRSTYILEVKLDASFKKNNQGYYYAFGEIDRNKITRIWKIKSKDNDLFAIDITKNTLKKSLLDIFTKGGRGSGNFAHAGRPGQIGGSGLEGNILITSKPSGFENDKNILSKEGTVVNYDANFLKQEKALSKRIKNEVRLWEGDRGDLAEAAVKEMSTPDSEYSEYRGIITKDKGEIVGAINYEFDRDKIYIHEIATKKKGYGENLIREVLKKAVENKIGIELFSTKEAADYYRKIGLKPKGRVPKGRAGIFELNYLEAKGWLTMHKSKYTEFEPESGCFADSRKVRDKRRRQVEKVSFTKMICDKIMGIKKEVNLFKEISLLDMLTKHFSGQHDQLSHGRRGGSNISESRTEKPAGSSRAGQSGKGGIGTWEHVLVKTTKVKVMNKKGIPIIDKETGKQKMKTKYTFLQENGKPLPKYMEGWSWRPNMKDPLYLKVDNPKDLKKIKVLAQGRVEGVLKDKWQCGLYKNPNGEKNTKTEGDYKKITVLDKNFDKVYAKNEKNRNSRDSNIRERADLTKLIIHSGIRVGGKEEENAAMRSTTSRKIGEEVYGASTLLGKHVVKEGGAVYLRFPAKSGVLYDYEITDKSVAKMMVDRAKKAGAKGNIFNQDAVEYGKISSYIKGLDSKQYTAKNFRTLLANRIAQKKISSMKKPKTKKEYIHAVNEVGITVGTVLGHRSKVPIYKKDKAGKPIKVKDKKTGKMVKVSTGKFEYKVSASTSIKNYISPALFKQWGEF